MECTFCETDCKQCPLTHAIALNEHEIGRDNLTEIFELAVKLRERENRYRDYRQRVEDMLAQKFTELRS